MSKEKSYYQMTEYQLEPAGLKKLDLIIEKVQKEFSNPEKTYILDIGCGSGNISLPLSYLGYQVIALDAFKEATWEIEKKNPPLNLKIVNESFENFSSQNKYDVIITSEFLEHTQQPKKALEKARLLLKDNGLLIITVPNGWSVEEMIRRLFLSNYVLIKLKKLFKKKLIEKEIQTPAQSPHLHFWSLAKVTRLIKSAGFIILGRKVYASIFKEFYYIFGRLFIKRGSKLFNLLNQADNKLADIMPIRFGSNWLIFVKKKL